MSRVVINKAKDIQCQICQEFVSGYNFSKHVLATHQIIADAYASQYGEFRKNRAPKEKKRDSVPHTCNMCQLETTTVGLFTHLRDTHNITMDAYVAQYGEFRKSKILHANTKERHHIEICKICNDNITRTDRDLTFHLQKQHAVAKLDYVTQYIFGGNLPICKCGCGQNTKILPQYPYYREYISGHNSIGITNPMFGKTFSEQSRAQMSVSAKARVELHKQNTSGPLPMHAPTATKIRGELQSQRRMEDIEEEYGVVILAREVRVGHAYYTLQCKTCSHQFQKYNDVSMLCPICVPSPRSILENEIYEFLVSIVSHPLDIVRNARKILDYKELDFYIADKQLAIEFDGLYYHGEMYGKKKRSYHLDKTLDANNKGIHLVHIFEDEWIYRKDIVKSKLKSLITHTCDQKIYARKCTVRKISASDGGVFLDTWHLQGKSSTPIGYGLFYDTELISVMTFAKPNASRNVIVSEEGVYELSRYAVKANIVCVGGASKLLTAFEREYTPKKLISYADRRWCSQDNNVYKTLNFTLERINGPSYWYVFGNTRKHRFNYTKKKTVELGGDPDKTEWENMQARGIDRIWDCGTLRYVKMY